MTSTIGIIYTGGTIGMDAGKDGLVASNNFNEKIFRQFPEYKNDLFVDDSIHNNQTIKFDFIEFEIPMDSSHADLQFAVEIYNRIQRRSNEIQTWLVLMGSDTLPYIAACLAYLLHQSTLSVIVSGAMKPLTAPDSDAILNLRFALETLQHNPKQGVNVVFGGLLLPAVRCTKLYAGRDDAIVNTATNYVLPVQQLPNFVALPHDREFKDFDIRVIRVAPSMHVNFVRNALGGHPDAVLIQCYGAGTTPAENSAFGQAIKELAKKGVPLFAISQTLDASVDFSIYAASAWLGKLGVIRCGDMNLEAAYTKLWYLLNHNVKSERLADSMLVNLCGEISNASSIQ